MSERQVLEFELNDEQYCTGIKHVSEIVGRSEDNMTSVPNAPPHVEGMMDLRGETTTIIDPRKVLSLEMDRADHNKVIVFESDARDDGNFGWAVRDVTRVSKIETDNVEEVEERTVKGIINQDDGFLVWTSPDLINSTVRGKM